MGAPMARRLAGWPGGLVVYDTRPEAMAPLVTRGCHGRGQPRRGGRRPRGSISVMVRDDDQVREVVRGRGGAGAQAARAAAGRGPPGDRRVHSTIGAGHGRGARRRAGRTGVEVVDAPVSGGFMGAQGRPAGGHVRRLAGGLRAVPRAVRLLGGPDHAHGAGRRGDPGQAGAQPAALRRVHRGRRGAAAGRGGRDRPAQAGRVVRHSDAVTGGAGSIMLRPTTAPWSPADPLREILEHVRALGRRTWRWRWGSAPSSAWTCRWRGSRWAPSPPGWACRSPRTARTARTDRAGRAAREARAERSRRR